MITESNVQIRPYQASDQNSVLNLWKLCGLIVPHNDPTKDIKRKLHVSPEWFLVLEVEGQIAGSCMVGYEGHRGWINYLAVDPAFQCRGFGRLLMHRAEEILRVAGCPKINLQVRRSNKGVIAFYKSIGFSEDPVVSMGKRLVTDERS